MDDAILTGVETRTLVADPHQARCRFRKPEHQGALSRGRGCGLCRRHPFGGHRRHQGRGSGSALGCRSGHDGHEGRAGRQSAMNSSTRLPMCPDRSASVFGSGGSESRRWAAAARNSGLRSRAISRASSRRVSRRSMSAAAKTSVRQRNLPRRAGTGPALQRKSRGRSTLFRNDLQSSVEEPSSSTGSAHGARPCLLPGVSSGNRPNKREETSKLRSWVGGSGRKIPPIEILAFRGR